MNRARLTSIAIVVLIVFGLSVLGLGRRTTPVVQPIPFSHKLHTVGQDMECTVCHSRVTKHARATLPSIRTCQQCHSEPMTETELEKGLLAFTTENREIPWKRVYQVPDHVYFSHRRHVTLGNVQCESCHGNMRNLSEPPEYPLVPVTMANCIKCHEQYQITSDCLACHR